MSEMRKRSAGRDPDLSGVRQSGYRTGSAGDPEYPETASGSAAGASGKGSIPRDPGESEKNSPADRGGCGDRLHCVVPEIMRNEGELSPCLQFINIELRRPAYAVFPVLMKADSFRKLKKLI